MARRRKHPVLRWAGRVVLGAVALGALVVGGALAALHTDWGRDLARRQIERQLAAKLVGGATIGRLEGSPFGELVVRELVIAGPDGKPAITVGALHLEVALLPLWSHEVQLDHVIADDVEVALARNPDGSLQIAQLIKPSPPTTWSVSLPDVELHRGHVHVGDDDIDDIRIDATVNLPRIGTTRATAIGHASLRRRGAAAVDFAVAMRGDDALVDVPAALISAGGAGVAIADLRVASGETPVFSGLVAASAPAAAIAQLAPGVQLPEDVAIAAIAGPIGATSAAHAALFGRLGATPVRGFVRGDLAAKTAAGMLVTGELDVTKLARGTIAGRGAAVVAFDAAMPARAGALPVARAMITAWGTLAGAPPVRLAIAVTSDDEHVRAVVGGVTPGARIGFGATVHRRGDALTLDAARLVAVARDPARISRESPALYGTLRANLAAHGELSPAPNLAIAGTANGRQLRYGEATVAAMQLQIDAHDIPSGPLGNAHLRAPRRRQRRRPRVRRGRPHRRESPRPRDRDRRAHAPAQRPLARRCRRGRHDRRDDDRAARASSRAHRRYRLDWLGRSRRDRAARRHGGEPAHVEHARLARHRRQLHAHRRSRAHHARGRCVGRAHRPREARARSRRARAPRRCRGLARMPRAALHAGDVTIHADLGRVAALANLPGISGTLDARLAITARDVTGTIDIRKLKTPALAAIGEVSTHVELAQRGRGDLATTAVANLDGIGALRLTASAATPARPFDVAAWTQMNRGAFHGARVQLDPIELGPGLLDRLHVRSELRGEIDLAIDIPAGAPSAKLAFDVHQLRGGVLARPLDVHLDAELDDRATATLGARAAAGELVSIHASLPITFASLLADPRSALAQPLAVELALPSVAATQLLAMFGRTDIARGTIDGTIEIAGTLARPTLAAKIVGHDLTVPPGITLAQPQIVRSLAIVASWDGELGKLEVTGHEASGGKLHVVAQGSPRAPERVTASLDASKFDVRTLTAFAPGVVGAISGELDGTLSVTGVDPRTMDLEGKLAITNARIPVAPTIGTLRDANVRLAIANHVVKLEATGELGDAGTVKLVAEAPLVEGAPSGGKATLALRKVQSIGTTQPLIDSDISATITRKNDTWHADVHVANTLVKVPDEKGQELDPVGAPTDLVYDGAPRPPPRARTAAPKAPPPHPILVAKVDLGDVTIESADARGVIHGKLDVSLGQAQVGGSSIGVVGEISARRGQVELFGRRYEIDRATMSFDGSTDPQLDVRVTYDFPEVSTITEVHGRLSKPELALSSEPAIYSQGELLGFLLGGEPNGDTQQQAQQTAAARVSGAGTSLIANQVSGYLKKALPVSVDVIRYEAATSVNSAAVTIGSWLTHTLFLAYREHLDVRPDENENEGLIEYYIEPRVVLQGTAGDRAYDGADLLWRRRW